MSPALATLLLAVLAGSLVTIPLLPAIIELRLKRDAQPLDVIQQYGGDIRHFAYGFRRIAVELQPQLQECVAAGTTVTGALPDGDEYVLLGHPDESFFIPATKRDSTWRSVVVAGADLALPDDLTFAKEIYAAGDLTGGERNTFRAILGEKNIHLQRASKVIRWAHAVRRFRAEHDCDLYGRISADQEIQLQSGCVFQRVNAPLILSGFSDPTVGQYVSRLSNVAADAAPSLPPAGRTLYDGDLEIRVGEVVPGSVVTRGKLHISSGARVLGSVKSNGHLTMDSGASVDGSLIGGTTMHVGSNCRIGGPVLAERGIVIESGTHCGSAVNPTTVAAPTIELEEGVLVFGTLWARNEGRVVPTP
ncbi:MAG: polymer-forming cytoskeletal protein [Candidatus Acidiferrales bacterium]